MFHLISVLKSLLMALLLVFVLQVKVGESTLEDRAVLWFQNSPVTVPLQQVAEGAAKIVRDTLNRLGNTLDVKLFEKLSNAPGSRDLGLRMQRSQQYIQEQAERAARKVEEELHQQEESVDSSQ